jgi:hypothetical protein
MRLGKASYCKYLSQNQSCLSVTFRQFPEVWEKKVNHLYWPAVSIRGPRIVVTGSDILYSLSFVIAKIDRLLKRREGDRGTWNLASKN